MYKLYHYPYSQHARRVVSLLEEASLEYELKPVAMDKGEYLTPAYHEINPNYQVPTLIDDDIKIHESNAILRYLCIKHGLKNWYPDDLKLRAIVEQWLDWNQCRLSPVVIDIVVNKVFMGDDGDMAAIKRGEENIKDLFTIFDNCLADNDYIAGTQATIADLSIASNIFQLGIAETTSDLSNITLWYQRISELRGFKKSLPSLDK